MMFLGECTQKNHFAQKQTKQGKKAKLLSLLSVSFPPLFFSLFSLVSSQQKTSSLSSCSRFHFKRKTHLSSLRAQFRAHTSSRAETSSLLFCVPSILLKSVLREKRERRERVVCGYSCVHHFDWRKKHAQVINESTSHLFFSFQKRISSRIPSTTDGGIAKKSRRSRRGVVRACDKNQKEE